MMSALGRSDYSLAKAQSQENILDIIARTGVKIVWFDNQSGCKRVCDRVERINTSQLTDPAFCKNGECYDEILIKELENYLGKINQDTLIVLHQMGSHGPAYYRRYPPAYEKFKPTCKTSQLDKCAKEDIVNAYDNTIYYTDHVLASLINVLQKNSGHNQTGLFYMSDHGESLGEMGLYLHAAPYLFAPDAQIHVPSIMWLSDSLKSNQKISTSCLQSLGDKEFSHDNLFYSLLGIFDISTHLYQADKDILGACRGRANP
jgi:lipid A ethanolaminephosphotransferase